MSLLAAAAPVAVLVLAWDETAPAVRALVEATDPTAPALDSVVVLVPAAAGELMQEEFLPLPAEVAPVPLVEEEGSTPTEAALPDEAANQPSEPAPASKETTLPSLPPAPLAPSTPLALSSLAKEPTPPLAKLLVAAPASSAAVRVLRLSSFSLPELTALSHQALPHPIWQSSSSLPTAPYLGSKLTAASDETANLAAPAQPEAAEASPRSSAAPLSLPHPTLAAAQPEQPLPALPTSAPTYQLTEPLLPALDAEADLAPILPEELLTADDAATETLLAEAPTADPADWAGALASLRTPLPIEEPAPATDLEDEAAYYAASTGEQPATPANDLTELRPPSQPFEAPDLNFQVIQYARFAVPVALAQAPFAAIYAPAWPTWLAAQELRYRTRQPLVLHVATLAAGADESVATATSWQAEVQRQALQRADLILAETPELTRRLRHDLGLPPELVRTVPAADAAAVAQALRTAQLRPTLNMS